METPNFALKSWTLEGFRAIRDETTFDLGGLNLLVGANSAGKSSVLYSILMAAQTLGNPLADRPLVLNGALVALGLADDCVHEETKSGVKLGFDLIPEEPQQTWRGTTQLGRVSVESTFKTGTGNEFTLESTKMTGVSVDTEVPEQAIEVAARTDAESREALVQAGLAAEVADAASRGLVEVRGDFPKGVAGGRVRQFLPQSLVMVGNEHLSELRTFMSRVIRLQRQGHWVGPRRQGHPLSPPASEILRKYVADQLDPGLANELARMQPLTAEMVLEHFPPDLVPQLREILRGPWVHDHKDDIPFLGRVEVHDLEDLLDVGSEYIREWFGRSVRHLGPLRASPKPLYALPQAASGASVGAEGEYTASVLSAYGKRRIQVPLPDGEIRNVNLSRAVDLWMEHLGLLAAVRSEDKGKLGFELHLTVEGVNKDLDLTTVGVGVSQALPIVVLGLIAESGSLVLFEQPELHLHPDVQAGLGDFFLALAHSGRQLIVETHSEYLINRLRRRQAASGAKSDVTELVRLFFFEREGSTSNVTKARIAVDGGMPDWPQGFLDTAAREVEAMIHESAD